jgi:hypothetical protein
MAARTWVDGCGCSEAGTAAAPFYRRGGNFVRARAYSPRALQERRLENYDFVARILVRKTLAAEGMVIALRVTLTSEK